MKIFRVVQVVVLLSLLVSNPSYGIEPKVHTVESKGTVFRHFEIELSVSNTLLPKEINSRERLDDTADNFKYGQFEVFIPAKYLKLPLRCKGNYIVRMPQTIDGDKQEIERKQSLYYAIRDARQGRSESLRVVLEMSYAPGYACNLFFREDGKGKYIDHVGKIRS
jgi:hypothetical protein